MQQKNKVSTKKLLAIIIIFVVVIVSIGVLAMNGVFHRNPYGDSIKIDNYRKYFSHLNIDYYDRTTSSLYDMVSESLNNGATIPKSGAIIREGSLTESQTETANLAGFIVDIPSIERTYSVSFTLPIDNQDVSTIIYPVIILCPSENILIYPKFPCTDMNTNNSPITIFYEKYPFLTQLPITVSKYNDKTEYIDYKITYQLDEETETIKLIITDNTGNGHGDALAKLRAIGVNTSSFTIEYINASQSSSNMTPGRPKR